MTAITVSTAPNQGQAIGELSTSAGALAALFPAAVIDFGTDGPGANGGVSNVLTLVLSGETVGTNLTATALKGTALEGLSEAERAIVLVQVDANTIEGRIVGTADAGDDFVAFRITLEGGSDPATAKITVDQFLAIDHGGSENPSVFDEQTFLNLVGEGTLNLQLTTTATDGDGDQVSSPVQVNLIGNENSFIAFDDDGPTLAVTAPAAINGLDFGSFALNNNAWGTGSGTATGTNGGWTIDDANQGHSGGDLIGNTGGGAVQLERVGDGYQGMHSSTNGLHGRSRCLPA